MSVPTRERPAEAVAGLMAAASIFVSLMAIAYKPARVIPVSLLVALIAVAMGGRHARLAAAACAVGALSFLVGMTIAVLTDRALY